MPSPRTNGFLSTFSALCGQSTIYSPGHLCPSSPGRFRVSHRACRTTVHRRELLKTTNLTGLFHLAALLTLVCTSYHCVLLVTSQRSNPALHNIGRQWCCEVTSKTLSGVRLIPAKSSLTQWRFFKKCRIEDIFCFASISSQNFLKWLEYFALTSKVTKAARNTLVSELLCNNVFFHGESTVKPELLPSTSVSWFKTYLSRCIWSLMYPYVICSIG